MQKNGERYVLMNYLISLPNHQGKKQCKKKNREIEEINERLGNACLWFFFFFLVASVKWFFIRCLLGKEKKNSSFLFLYFDWSNRSLSIDIYYLATIEANTDIFILFLLVKHLFKNGKEISNNDPVVTDRKCYRDIIELVPFYFNKKRRNK